MTPSISKSINKNFLLPLVLFIIFVIEHSSQAGAAMFVARSLTCVSDGVRYKHTTLLSTQNEFIPLAEISIEQIDQ